MSSLSLQLLGSPRLERGSVARMVGRRKAVVLLAYLALTGESHRREALAASLWPDYGETEAHAYLRQAIWALKRALGGCCSWNLRENVERNLSGGKGKNR